MKQLMDLTVLQIKRRLLVEIRSQGETESLSLCHLKHLWSCWLQLLIWNARKNLVCIFSSPLCLFNKSLAESCKRQKEVPFQWWGWNLQGVFFTCEHDRWKILPKEVCTSGSQAPHVQMHLVNTGRKIPRPPAWELHESSKHMTYLFIMIMSHGKPRSHNLSSTGCTWVPQVADCRPSLTARVDFPIPHPAQQIHRNLLKFILYIMHLIFLLFISWNMV